jgi:hypothetical protein
MKVDFDNANPVILGTIAFADLVNKVNLQKSGIQE